MSADCRFEQTPSKGATRPARSANKFARASPGERQRGAAQRERQTAANSGVVP